MRLLTMPIGRTRPTGIPWVYQMHGHACPGRFVGEELAQVEEAPGVPLVAMFASNRGSLSDSTEIFKSDCLARYDGFLDEPLADAVVGGLGLALELPQAQIHGIPFFL